MSRIPEREYIYGVIMREFLGMNCSVLYEERTDIEIMMPGDSHARIQIQDVLLQTDNENWLQPSTLPKLPLDVADVHGMDPLPVLYGCVSHSGQYVEVTPEMTYCGIDIFGSSLFMLTRYEEVVLTERDQHGRFSATQSIAFQAGFLERPIVNEYVELLWTLMVRLWPDLQRRKRYTKVTVSHDVDFPYYMLGRSRFSMLKESLGDIVRRKDVESGLKKAAMVLRPRSHLMSDPYNTFKWLMQLSERAGIRSSFYFITEQTVRGLDGNYRMDDFRIQQLLREIHERGHEIGLHPSYDTYKKPDRIKNQFDRLLNIATDNGIRQLQWGGRQHFLRWEAPVTWQYWEDAGLHYDSTLSYADHAGFRCGVCYEYPVFNLLTRRQLKLRERPLVVMDQSIVHPAYMGLTKEQACDTIHRFYEQCKKYRGEFTLLWHNSQLVKSSDRAIYQACIEKFK